MVRVSSLHRKARMVILLEVLLSPVTATHIVWPSQLQPCQPCESCVLLNCIFCLFVCLNQVVCCTIFFFYNQKMLTVCPLLGLLKSINMSGHSINCRYFLIISQSVSLFCRTGWIYLNNNYKKKSSALLPKLLQLCFSTPNLNGNYVDRQSTAVHGYHGDLISIAQEMFI